MAGNGVPAELAFLRPMAPHPAPARADHDRDPIDDARALVAMAIGLGQRTRTAHRLGLVTDRKATLYLNTLVRHAARVLQTATSHDVPVLRSSSTGPGGSAVHFVIRHDRLVGPPSANRFLVVGSDARLRCCIVADAGGARIWADYDVATAPDGLPLRVVLDALAAIVARLEQTVIQLETRELVREAQLEADIAAARARIAGVPSEAPLVARRHARSEEPVRPWTRHLPTAEAAPAGSATEALPPEVQRWARPAASAPAASDGSHGTPPHGAPPQPTENDAPAAAAHDASDDLVFVAIDVPTDSTITNAPTAGIAPPAVAAPSPPAHRTPRSSAALSRLHKAI